MSCGSAEGNPLRSPPAVIYVTAPRKCRQSTTHTACEKPEVGKKTKKILRVSEEIYTEI